MELARTSIDLAVSKGNHFKDTLMNRNFSNLDVLCSVKVSVHQYPGSFSVAHFRFKKISTG